MDKLSSVLGDSFTDLLNSKNNIMRFVWLIFFILSMGGCFYLITTSIIDYKNYDFITNIEIFYVPELDLPAVTLCPINFKNPDNLYILDYQVDGKDVNKDAIEKVFMYHPPSYSNKSCLRFNGNNTFSPKEFLKAKKEGSVAGLSLIYYTNNESIPGVSTYVHGNTVATLLSERILTLVLNQMSSIVIEKTIQTSLGPPFSNCINEEDRGSVQNIL